MRRRREEMKGDTVEMFKRVENLEAKSQREKDNYVVLDVESLSS